MALAFLPTSEVKNFFDNLKAKYVSDPQVQKFHDYFSNTWIDGLFAINLWNQFDVPDQQRTNNTVEGWHCRFGGYVRSVHPNIYILLSHIKREERMTSLSIDQARLKQPQRKKKSKYDQLHHRIQALFKKYREKNMTVDELFLEVRHIIHVFN